MFCHKNVTPSTLRMMVKKVMISQQMSQQRSWLLLFTEAVQSRQCKCIFLVILSSGSSQLAPTSSSLLSSGPRITHYHYHEPR